MLMRAIFFAWLAFNILAAQESEFASMEISQDFIIDGMVNVISGAFVDSSVDYEIPSIYPMRLTRSTIPLHYSHDLLNGWHLDFCSLAKIERHPTKTFIEIRDDNATSVHFRDSTLIMEFLKGYTNTGRDMSGKVHLKNYRLERNNEAKSMVLSTGSGEKRYYRDVSEGDKFLALLNRTETCSGFSSEIIEHNKNQFSKRWFSPDHQCMGDLNYLVRSDFLEKPITLFYGPLGPLLYSYEITQEKKDYYPLLKEIKSPTKPTVTYEFDTPTKHHKKRYIKKKIGDSYVSLRYYTIGEDGTPVDQQWKNNRVKALYRPADHNNLPTPCRQFFYYKRSTTVLDAYGNVSEYYYDDDYRPTYIVHKNSKINEITHKYIWKEGNLATKVVYNHDQSQHKTINYHYDKSGNVTYEKFFGAITGEKQVSFPKIYDYGEVGGSEFYAKIKTYSDDGLNNIIKITEGNGLVTEFEYIPGTDRLKQKTISGEGYSKTFTYQYHPCGARIEEVETDGFITFIKRQKPLLSVPCFGFPLEIEELYLEDGIEKFLKRTTYSYHKTGKVEKLEVFDDVGSLYIEGHEYDDHGNCYKSTLRTGEIILRTFNTTNDTLEKEECSSGLMKSFTYNLMNQCRSLTETYKSQKLTTKYTYNLLGAKDSETDSFGQVTRFICDRYNRPCIIHHPQGEEKREYDIFGNVLVETDAKGYQKRATYSYYDKPLTIEYPDGTTEFFTYNLDGSLKSHTDQSGLKCLFKTDCFGRVHKKSFFNKEGILLGEENFEYAGMLLKKIQDLNGVWTTFEYDGAGRKIYEECAGSVKRFEYDALGRVTRTIYEDQGKIALVEVEKFDTSDRVIRKWVEDAEGNHLLEQNFGYDFFGNCKLKLQGESKITYDYDPWGRLTEKKDPNGITTWDYVQSDVLKVIQTTLDGVQTVELYNEMQNLVLLEQFDPSGVKISSVSFSYDLNGNLEEEVHQVLGLAKTISPTVIERSYDSMNRLSSLKERSKITSWTYTLSGEKETVKKPDGTILTYTYDDWDHLKSVTGGEIGYEYIYDPLGRLLNVSDINTSVIRKYTPRGEIESEKIQDQVFLYEYDGLDRLTKITLPDNSTIHYTHCPVGLSGVFRSMYSHEYIKFDSFGNVIEEKLADRSTRFKSYDLSSRLKSIQHPKYSLSSIEYDVMGNLKIQDSKTYNYDSLNQLIRESSDEFNNSFTFDSVYNCRKKNNQEWQIDVLNQLKLIPDHAYTYDLNGNLKTKSGSDGNYTFFYDAFDRLIKVDHDGEIHKYFYDGLHRRISKITPTTKEDYWYLGDKEIGNAKTLRILGSGLGAEIGATIAIEYDQRVFVPHYDQVGNLTQLGFESCSYSAFGEQTNKDFSSPWTFSSKRLDSETGFIFFGRRYYDPTQGRWISCDPLNHTDGVNLYAYVKNSPLSHFDAYGLFIRDLFAAQTQPLSLTLASHAVNMAQTPQFQGSMQALGGLFEASIGAQVSYASGGFAAPLGFAVMAHGLDHMFTGIETAWSGSYKSTATSQLLQLGGMSPYMADAFDFGFSLGGMAGSASMIARSSHLAHVSNHRILSTHTYQEQGLIKDKNWDYSNNSYLSEFSFTNSAGKHIKDIVKKGEFAGQLSRPYMNSPLTIREIMSSAQGTPDKTFTGGMNWRVQGKFRGSSGIWELGISPETKLIYHFNFTN